jgi:hypothetical protein
MTKRKVKYLIIRGISHDKLKLRHEAGTITTLETLPKTVINQWLKTGVIKVAADE